MGYMTYHDMYYLDDHGVEQKLIDIPRDTFAADFERVAGYPLDLIGTESVKWYECEDHMKLISLMYPNITFVIYGDGEDSDDFWKGYYCNGASSIEGGVMTYHDNPFTIKVTESKLKYKL